MNKLNTLAFPPDLKQRLQTADVVNGVIMFDDGTRTLPTTPTAATRVIDVTPQQLIEINEAANRATAFTQANPGGVAPNLTKQQGVDAYGKPLAPSAFDIKWLLPILIFGGFVVATKLKKKK